MHNYAMEWRKFSARKIESTYPITAIKMNKILCQDILFNLGSSFTEIESLKFSTAYFYDFHRIRKRVAWENIYVLDGVEFLHRQSGSNKPLIRDRALYSFLYLSEDSTYTFAEAIVTNPWLSDLCNMPLRLMSERVSVIKNMVSQVAFSKIYKAVEEDLDSGFTPRGVWGLDYMFMWKSFHVEPALEINEDLKLIPLLDYVKSFSKE
ncbi:hypothetical protein [Lysinibacillus xylanilyticus]|uniref:hypothetical protein n=1 Tax=Lysinibacillus xylanilyticus TaxID=582475 RepID=UPI0036DBA71D